MGEIIVTPGLKGLFEKLRRNELPESIKWWEGELTKMEPLVKAAEEHQFERPDVKMWLNDLQDWSYDLEDFLDDFATDLQLKEVHPQQQQQNTTQQQNDDDDDDDDSSLSTSSSYFCCCNEVMRSFFAGTINFYWGTQVNKIENLNKRLEDIQNVATWFKYLPQSLSREELQIRRPETSSIPSNDVLGRDYVRRQIINLLLTEEPNDDRNYIVIAIVGQGGIGKTTLAQSVYNDDFEVKPHFDIKAWVCVSEVFDVHQITTTIINSVSGHNPSEFNNLNKAQEKLQEILFRKKFLIVLDDVWSENYELWDQLQVPFRKGFKGSKVIVTTRMERVARTMKIETTQSHFVYLKGLSDDECWRICKQHAVISDDPIDEMRDQVTKLSKGLPLAAKALGGLLRQNDRLQWSTILRRNSWKKQTGVIMPALRLSYYHLPLHLKRVFVYYSVFPYCSVFPKDYRMVKNDVVLMWMAEGFLPDSKDDSMESKGHSYFDDLVSRSLFEPTSHNGKRYFIMHDLIHDLAQWVASDFYCRLQRNDDDDVTYRTRFLFVNGEIDLAQFMKDKAGKKLRTFAILKMPYYFKNVYALNFQKLQCIRVLCMGEMRFEVLPSSIGYLKHLQLLDLSRNFLKELPESMSMLCNLQTLILKQNYYLTEVFKMRGLIELRHLDIEQCRLLLEMPSGFMELRNMRTSRRFIIAANSGPRISDLENLKYLSGSLDIFGLENVMNSEDAQRARMNEKLDLKILRNFWGTLTRNSIMSDPIDRLKQEDPKVERELLNQLKPPDSIKEVELDGYMGITFPDWLGSPSFNNMVVIKLKDCSKCERLPPFGQLPCLEKVEIRECPLLLQEGDTPSFPPSLKKLHIIDCPKLKVNLPSCPLLEELVLKGCRELNSIDKPVICCSRSVILDDISSFSGVEGFWVPNIVTLHVTECRCSDDYELDENVSKIYIESCPELLSWRPENLYGELTKLTDVTLQNCKAWTSFFECKFPSSLRRLSIYKDNTIKDISKFTQQSTCLNSSTLQELIITYTEIEEPTKEWKLDLLTCLKTLVIRNAGTSTDEVESIPDPDLPLPPSLVHLTILNFKNLKSISCSSLPYLAGLDICGCPQMKREGIHVPQDFVFKGRDGRCRVDLNDSKFELQ